MRKSSMRPSIDRLFLWPITNEWTVADWGVPEIAVTVLPTPFTQIWIPAEVFVIAIWFH